MLKLIIAFERQAPLSRAECQDYLRNSHAVLVKSVEEFHRYLKGYVQNFTHGSFRSGGIDFDADAVAQLWFDNVETFTAAFSEPRYLELIRPDELHFADPNRLICACAEESLQWDDGAIGDLKFFRFLSPLGASQESTWRSEYPTKIAESDALRKKIKKYVRNWSIAGADEAFSGAQLALVVEEFWLSSDTDIAEFLKLESAVLESCVQSAARVDIANSVTVIARERVVVPVSS